MDVRRSLTAVVAVFFIGVFPTEWFGLYDYLPNFDKILHFLGGFVIAWFVWAVAHRALARAGHGVSAGFIVGLTTLVGVLWEFAEYYSSHLWGKFAGPVGKLVYLYFHGGDLADTLADLAFDISGALVVVAILLLRASANREQS